MTARLMALALLLAAPPSRAAPRVHVRGHAVLRVLGIHPSEDGSHMVGVLRDRALGTPLARRAVVVRLQLPAGPVLLRAVTDQQGQFRVALPPNSTRFTFDVRFAGDDSYAAERPPQTTLDLTKATPEIALDLAPELDLGQPHQRLRLATRIKGRNVSLPLQLRRDDGTLLAQVTTDQQGSATLQLGTERLGAPGPVTIEARFVGDATRNPVRVQVQSLLLTTVQLSLEANERQVPADGTLRLRGAIRDTRGPVAGATVSLEAMGRHLRSVTSAADGQYRFHLRARDFPPGPLDLAVRFTPQVIWRRAATSAPLQVTVLPPTPIPTAYYALAAGASALLLLALLAFRFGPRLRRSARQPEALEDADDERTEGAVASGLRPGRSQLRTIVKPTLRIDGQAWNPVDRVPIPGAELALVPAASSTATPVRTCTADATGRFALEAPSSGSFVLRARCSGYVSEQVTIALPHRGQLQGFRLDLVQVRVRLLELYRSVATPLLPRQSLWARWTPRELSLHVGRSGQGKSQLRRLTHLLERAYWAPQPLDESALEQARELLPPSG